MKEIILSNNKGVALVDDADWDMLSQWKWSRTYPSHGKVYASRSVRVYVASGLYRNRLILMHRLLLGVTDRHIFVDHKDEDGLHNWRGNLRLATNSQNQACSRLKKNPARSGFRGVRFCKGAWTAQIVVNGTWRYLGRFSTAELAAAEYDRVAVQSFGEFARPNFAQEKTSWLHQ